MDTHADTASNLNFDEAHQAMRAIVLRAVSPDRIPAILARARMGGRAVRLLHVVALQITLPLATDVSETDAMEWLADAILAWDADPDATMDPPDGTDPVSAREVVLRLLPQILPCPFRDRFVEAESDREYERDDDEATGQALGGRGIEDEIPDAAMANYRSWRRALKAGEPTAVAVYEQIPHAEAEGVALHMLGDAMDGGDEEELCRTIFGERYGDNVASVLRDDWMHESTDFERAVSRLRKRLDAGCPTPSDIETIREDALRRIRDEELLAVRPFQGDESDAREIWRQIVRARAEYACHDTGLPIAVGDRHLVLIESVEGEVRRTRHSCAAAWCAVVMEDPSLCDSLRPGEAPLA